MRAERVKYTAEERGIKKKELKTWTIYVWQLGDVIYGAAPVVTVDGLKEIFTSAMEITSSYIHEGKDTPQKRKFWAKNQVKRQLQNTLNALNWYGKTILDNTGNVDLAKFKQKEILTQSKAIVNGIYVDISKVKPFKKYTVKEISWGEAKELQLI